MTVAAATAAKFVLTAATATPTAGEADNLTITALDAYGNLATSYAGSQSLTFSGASAIGTNKPTVANSSGTAIAFGTATAITFTAGVATVTRRQKRRDDALQSRVAEHRRHRWHGHERGARWK